MAIITFLVGIQMIWRAGKHEIDLTSHAVVMGIANVTVDSFSDGGKFLAPDAAIAHALEMAAQGAAIIDIGGESTRPGSEPVSAEVEMERVLPVIERMKDEGRRMKMPDAKNRPTSYILHPFPLLSIDTSKAVVARSAVGRGASIINDVTGLCGDPEMMNVVRETGAGVVIMHMQGTPQDMQRAPHYGDVVAEVSEFFRHAFARAVEYGISPMNIAFDPGIGFGKSVAHNLLLLKNIESLRVENRPMVVGVSRKSFIGEIIGSKKMGDRFAPTVALACLARERGANVLRVHDVLPNVHALRMIEAIMEAT
jgi:dihydropteroate synthase